MKKRDFHIHTIYSGHSAPDMTIKNIIQVAAERGMDEIAITEHSFDWHLGPKGNLELIREEVAQCETNMKVFVGMEIDPDSKNIGRLIFEDFDKNELYPLLVGTHGFPGLERGWHERFSMTKREKQMVYSKWFQMIEKVIESGVVDILAHPGRIIMQNEIIKEFDSNVLANFKQLFDLMRENNTAFELNEKLLKSFTSENLKQSYNDLITLASECNLNFSIGSDAHSLDEVALFNIACL